MYRHKKAIFPHYCNDGKTDFKIKTKETYCELNTYEVKNKCKPLLKINCENIGY